jgi:hypothetical protein
MILKLVAYIWHYCYHLIIVIFSGHPWPGKGYEPGAWAFCILPAAIRGSLNE